MWCKRNSPILYFGIAVGIVFGLLAFTLAARGGSAAADSPSIDLVAIDADSAGNTATHIDTINDCRSLPNVGTTFTVDIVVDQVPPPGIAGFAAHVVYDPAVLQVNNFAFNLLMASGGPLSQFKFHDELPDYDGVFALSTADLSGNNETGPGVIIRLTLETVGTGISPITFDDQAAGYTIPVVYDPDGVGYNITNIRSASIAVGQACAATGTDLRATAATVSAPASATANTPFSVSAGGTVVNNGPASPVNADVVVTLSMPSDCTAVGGNVRTVQGLSLAMGVPVTTADSVYSVRCTSPSFHSFTSSITAVLNDASILETSLGNNTIGSSGGTTVAVSAVSDMKLTFNSLTSTAATTASPMAGMTFNLTANLTVENLGPNGPTSVDGSVLMTAPSDCVYYTSPNPAFFTTQAAALASVPVSVTWAITCKDFGNHAFSVSGSMSAQNIHVTDAAGNNAASGSGSATLKVGFCGPDPAPAGHPLQNMSPALLALISQLTADGPPVPANLKVQLDCNFNMMLNDTANTPIDECGVQLVTAAPCSVQFDLNLDMIGGSPSSEPTIRLNPIGVTFFPAEFDWAYDTAIPNGTENGSGEFSIRTDAGLLYNGNPCTIDVVLDKAVSREGGLRGNVPESNAGGDLTNPNVWPNDLNAERALVESSFTPIPNQPPGITLWSRSIMPLFLSGIKVNMNVLTWEVTDPEFQELTGAKWIVVPFPGDVVNPDLPGSIGGNPDADDPPPAPPEQKTTYCVPHHVMLQFDGMAGSNVFISCKVQNSPMAWNLVDPDALLVSGDEGQRSNTSHCGLDADNDGLSANAETYWGSNALSADSDGDGLDDGPDNCKITQNPGQADYDYDGVGDACDPDVDGDGVANAPDLCPNTVAAQPGLPSTPVDSVGCSAAQVDADADGWCNPGAPGPGSPPCAYSDVCPSTPANTPVGPNGCSAAQVDMDGDGYCNPGAMSVGPGPCTPTDNCPTIANPDQTNTDGDPFGDVCDGCSTVPTAWPVTQPDADCDGVTDALESFVGSNPNVACPPVGSNPQDPPTWPPDFNNDRSVSLSDVFYFRTPFNHQQGDPEYSPRFDLNGDTFINLSDVLRLRPFFNKQCS